MGGDETAPSRRGIDSIRGARVLLVEDNPINQLVARSFLEINGLEVDVAANGAEGVEKALSGRYALVLMDIQMPVMDGLTATRTIRATPGFEHLPIVAMTANAMVTDYQNSLDAGMNDHITKPIDRAKFTETLIRWIEPAVAPSSLPRSAHLDTARALAMLGGSEEFYKSLLQTFLANHADEAQKIEHALAHRQLADARIFAHTLKGTAASLGAVNLSTHAATLEKAMLAQDEPAMANALAEVTQGLDGLCADLRAFFAERL